MALRMFDEWPCDTWPQGTVVTIQAIAWRDPHDEVKKRARAILDSKH